MRLHSFVQKQKTKRNLDWTDKITKSLTLQRRKLEDAVWVDTFNVAKKAQGPWNGEAAQEFLHIDNPQNSCHFFLILSASLEPATCDSGFKAAHVAQFLSYQV